jgi:TolA-binding protein
VEGLFAFLPGRDESANNGRVTGIVRTIGRLSLALFVLACCVGATSEENRASRVVQAAFKDGLFDLAERQAADFLQRFPNSELGPDTALLLSQSQLKLGKWQETVKTCEDAKGRWPGKKTDSFLFWRAEALTKGGEFDRAAEQYSELLSGFTKSTHRVGAQYGLAFSQFKLGRFKEASESVERLLKLPPKGDLISEAELLQGQIQLALENYDRAEAAFAAMAEKYAGTRTMYRAQAWRAETASCNKKWDDAVRFYSVVTDQYKAEPNKLVDDQMAAEAWFGAGWAWYRQEKYLESAEAFAQVLRLAQTEQLKRDALLKLGEAFVRGGKITDGVARLKSFVQDRPKDPMSPEVQMAIANLYFQQGDHGSALPEYAALVAKFPDSPLVARANFHAGWCAWKLNRLAEAAKYFQRVFDLTQETDAVQAAEALFKVGDAHFALGAFAEAIKSYQRLIASYPQTPFLDRAMFQLAQSYQRTRNGEAAIHALTSLIEQFPDSRYAAEAQFQIGLINVGSGFEEQARAAFQKVITRSPDSEWAGKAALAIGESFYREAKYDEAIAAFEKLIERAPKSDVGQRAFYNRGWCFYSKGEPERALAEFGEFIKRFPQSPMAPEVQFWIADYWTKQKDHLKAQEQFQLLVKDYPTSKMADTAQFMAGRAAYARQDYKAAVDLFESLIRNFPESSWRCDARFAQGDALTEMGQFDNAVIVFDSLLKEFPGCYLQCEALGRKGDCLFTLQRYEEGAVAAYRAALICAREGDVSLRNQLGYKLGLTYEKAGKLADAFEQFSRVVYDQVANPDPNAPPERFWLCKAGMAAAAIKEQMQQWREAIVLYEKMLDQCPDLRPLLEQRIRKIRVEHVIWF